MQSYDELIGRELTDEQEYFERFAELPDFNTYDGWQEAGWAIAKGQKAQKYGRLHDGTWVAMFGKDQAEPRGTMTFEDVQEMRPADEHRAAMNGPKPPRIILEAMKDGNIAVWVGASERGLEMVKKSKLRYDGRRHRWVGKRTDPDTIVKTLGEAGFDVDYRPASDLGV